MSDLLDKLAESEDGKLLKELLEDNSNELFGLPENYDPDDEDVSPEVKERFEKLLAELNKTAAPLPRVELTPVRAKTTVFDSKLGGVPYLPKGFEYPTAREGEYAGKPLRLLAQLNFGSLPHIDGFPEKGILQFYAGCDDDDLIGMDFDDGANQNSFRVIYHADITEDLSQLYSVNDMPKFDEDGYYPFEGEFLLKAVEPALSPISSADYRFDKAVLAAYNKLFGTDYDAIFGIDDEKSLAHNEDELTDMLYEACNICGTAMGGYAYFTQSDPRGYDDELAKMDILLFQLDSEGSAPDEIMWGDCGVGNFFISREDLEKLDFSNVLYNWDCC